MRSTTRRRKRENGGTWLIVAGITATVIALVFPVWSYADRSGTGAHTLNASTVSTGYGPLSGADRDFVVRIRLAGLWELPAGQQAQQKGTARSVRTAGNRLVEGHTFLDGRVRAVAAQLGISLPNQPTDEQKGRLTELSEARGEEYDRRFANVLRRAHGAVFPVVAHVRATTRNELVRALADDASTTVLDHIRALEDTGLVDFDALAQEAAAASPPPITRPAAPPGPVEDPGTPVPLAPSPLSSPSYSLPPAATRPQAARGETHWTENDHLA